MGSWYQSSQMGWLTPLAARHAFLGNPWESITGPVGLSGVWPGRRLRRRKEGAVSVAHLANCMGADQLQEIGIRIIPNVSAKAVNSEGGFPARIFSGLGKM